MEDTAPGRGQDRMQAANELVAAVRGVPSRELYAGVLAMEVAIRLRQETVEVLVEADAPDVQDRLGRAYHNRARTLRALAVLLPEWSDADSLDHARDGDPRARMELT